MKRYEEIKDIITNKLGIKDPASYKAYLDQFAPRSPNGRRPTQEEVDLLAPENVHCGDFWRAIDDLFGSDVVGNTENGKYSFAIDECNKRNLTIARFTGPLNIIDHYCHETAKLLEIGPGYGNLKEYCVIKTRLMYMGVDCFPKISGVLPTTESGLFPDEGRKVKFDIIYSSNVFQHMSGGQRSKWFEDIYNLLKDNGIFTFNLVVDSDNNPYTEHLMHYGQFTEIPKRSNLINELNKYFLIDYETEEKTYRVRGFVMRKRPVSS